MSIKKRIPVSDAAFAWTSPFSALKKIHPSLAPVEQPESTLPGMAPFASKKNRGRVDIVRQTAHRGGKTVTVVTGFIGIGQAEKITLAKKMQKVCGAGGTVKEGRIEIQGDHREAVAHILINAGFKPVFAGG